MSTLSEFSKAARELARNPLGVIALFIVLIYGMATIVIINGNHLDTYERNVFVWFLVTYPVLVLLTFAWLVSRHSAKLYAPRDFQDQSHWMELQQVRAAIIAAGDVSSSSGTETPNGNSVVVKSEVPQSKPAIKSKSKGRRPS
jgi:hypothetical protein